MNNPKISLIIPVYNGSDYIEECLDSAISQTLKEIEIICVNDGSTDNSLEILEKYASKDKRIKIVSKKNEGQGYARKVGLDSATGKYILFCDQDDKFSSNNSFQIAFDRIEKYNTDIAIFSFSYWDEENKRDIILSKKKTVFRVFEEKDLILGYVAPWLKIYRKSFLDNYDDWYFPKYAFIEDPPFHVQIMLRSNSITTIDKVLYLHRTTNPNSITLRKKFDVRHAEAVSVFCEKIKNVLLKENVLEEYLSYFINFTFITSYNYIDKSDYDKQFIQRIKLLLNKNIDVAKHFFGIKNNFDKDRTLLFYFDNCRNVENDVVLLSIISELTKKYNIILVTNDEKQYILPSEINHVEINLLKEKLNLLKENKIVELLVLMCLTFSSDVFISLPNLGNDIFRYDIMKKFDIKTICCNQECSFKTYEDKLYHYNVMTHRNQELKNANVVTWLTNYYNSIYLCENSNAILMPNPLKVEINNNSHFLNNKIICVGNFVCQIKRMDLIIEVFSKILRKKSDVELYLLGDYNSSYLDILLEKFEIPKFNIHLVGCVDNVSKYYEDCSVFLMFSELEYFTMNLLEAGAFGIPSIILDINCLEDIIIDGKNGFIIDRYDLDGISDKVVELLSNKELYNFMSQNSLEMAKRFSIDKIIDRWNNLIDLVININDQEEINKQLRKYFSTKNIDNDIFLKKILHLYEEYFSDSVLYYENKIEEQKQSIKQLQNSWSYRIGRVLTYPLSIPLEFYKYIRDYNLVKKSDLFDSEYYLANNEDVKKAKINPIKHYLKFGWKEGRNPSEEFNGNEYLNKRPDVRVAGICPLVHYIKFGKDEK